MKTVQAALLAALAAVVLLCSCSKDNPPTNGPHNSEKTFTATGFREVKVADQFQVSIRQGNTFSIKAIGAATHLNTMEVSTNATQQLIIGYQPANRPPVEVVKVEITMPQLQVLYAAGAATATITGFGQQPTFMRMELQEAAQANVTATPDELTFALAGTAKLQVAGTTAGMYGYLNEAASLDAYGLTSHTTVVDATGTAHARLTAQHKLVLEATGASTIRYRGNPPILYTETSGTATIIKEP